MRLAVLAWLATGSALAQDADSNATPAPGVEASPDDDARVVELNERGSRLYAEGDYRRAVELFLQAYAIEGDPNLLFNVAACYEGLGDRDAAIEKYRAFLAAPNADPEGRPRAEGAIERLLSNEQAQPPRAPLEPLAASAAVSAAAPAKLPAEDTAGPESSGAPAWVPWAVLGGGAAVSAAGVTIYLLGVADHREVTEAPGFDDPNAVVPSSRQEAEALVSSGDTKKLIGATTIAVGAATMVGGVAWWLLDRSSEAPGPPPLNVAMSPSGASIGWSGRF
jgi:tetratricopeptide (TPR) repeat protein